MEVSRTAKEAILIDQLGIEFDRQFDLVRLQAGFRVDWAASFGIPKPQKRQIRSLSGPEAEGRTRKPEPSQHDCLEKPLLLSVPSSAECTAVGVEHKAKLSAANFADHEMSCPARALPAIAKQRKRGEFHQVGFSGQVEIADRKSTRLNS